MFTAAPQGAAARLSLLNLFETQLELLYILNCSTSLKLRVVECCNLQCYLPATACLIGGTYCAPVQCLFAIVQVSKTCRILPATT